MAEKEEKRVKALMCKLVADVSRIWELIIAQNVIYRIIKMVWTLKGSFKATLSIVILVYRNHMLKVSLSKTETCAHGHILQGSGLEHMKGII